MNGHDPELERALEEVEGDIVGQIDRAQRDNVAYAQRWRTLMQPRPEGPLTDAEARRLFAKVAVEDWLETPL